MSPCRRSKKIQELYIKIAGNTAIAGSKTVYVVSFLLTFCNVPFRAIDLRVVAIVSRVDVVLTAIL